MSETEKQIQYCENYNLNYNNLSDYNVEKKDYNQLVSNLSEGWKVESKIFDENKKWPILVIFREIHSDKWVKISNLNSFLQNYQYFNFVASEWDDREISLIMSNPNLNEQEKYNLVVENINSWAFKISSEAVEGFFWNEIKTYWVESSRQEFIKLQQKSLLLHRQWKTNPKIEEKSEEFKNKCLINYRNKVFLNKTSVKIKFWDNNLWKNFIPIIVWGDHAEWLAKKAEKSWFKWYIVFTPNWYTELPKK